MPEKLSKWGPQIVPKSIKIQFWTPMCPSCCSHDPPGCPPAAKMIPQIVKMEAPAHANHSFRQPHWTKRRRRQRGGWVGGWVGRNSLIWIENILFPYSRLSKMDDANLDGFSARVFLKLSDFQSADFENICFESGFSICLDLIWIMIRWLRNQE